MSLADRSVLLDLALVVFIVAFFALGPRLFPKIFSFMTKPFGSARAESGETTDGSGNIKATFAGLATVAVGIALAAWVVPDEQLRKPVWVFIFLALAVIGFFCWRHPEAPKTPIGWLGYVAAAVLVGVVWVAIDALLYGLENLSIVLDLMLAIFGGILALSGVVQSWVRQRVT
jgi:hypothetical protein